MELDEGLVSPDGCGSDLVALDDGLSVLAKIDPREPKVVALRFFGGLSVEEIPEVVRVSGRTVTRQ